MSRDRTVRAPSGGPAPRRRRRPVQRLFRGRLRLRALVAALALTLVALAAFDIAAVTALRSYLLDQTDTALRNAAQAIQPQLNRIPPGLAARQAADEVGAWTQTHQFLVGMYSVLYIPTVDGVPDIRDALADEDGPSGDDVAPNVPLTLSDLASPGQAQNTRSVLGDPLRSVAVRSASGTAVISTSLDDVDNTVNRMRLIVLIGSAAAALLIGLGLYWLLRRGLRPIETMAAEADRITAGNLTDRVTTQDPHSEVGRLGTALNDMLARIQTSVHDLEAAQELMRRFFADASHELRGPLASLRANAELYHQGVLTEPAQIDEVMRRIAVEAQRMSGLVNDMLNLARLDQHPERQREPIDLTDLVANCLDRILIAAPDHRWHADIATGVSTVGDEELLRRAVDNLLANVLTHTPAGTEATLTLRAHADTTEIEVADTGPGVPPDQLPRIFDRFYRAESAAERPGSGLGLAIVTQITTVHNGTVTAEPSPPHGLRVRIALPVRVPSPSR